MIFRPSITNLTSSDDDFVIKSKYHNSLNAVFLFDSCFHDDTILPGICFIPYFVKLSAAVVMDFQQNVCMVFLMF